MLSVHCIRNAIELGINPRFWEIKMMKIPLTEKEKTAKDFLKVKKLGVLLLDVQSLRY